VRWGWSGDWRGFLGSFGKMWWGGGGEGWTS